MFKIHRNSTWHKIPSPVADGTLHIPGSTLVRQARPPKSPTSLMFLVSSIDYLLAIVYPSTIHITLFARRIYYHHILETKRSFLFCGNCAKTQLVVHVLPGPMTLSTLALMNDTTCLVNPIRFLSCNLLSRLNCKRRVSESASELCAFLFIDRYDLSIGF